MLCAASIEESVPGFLRGSGKGWVTAEYSMLPRATATRTAARSFEGPRSGRTMEIQRLIGRSLRSVVDLRALGERSVILDCDVLQADGGTRTAAITGAYIAMSAALRQLVKFGALKKSPILDFVAATSVGVLGGVAMLDLCYQEDSQAEVDMNVVMTGSGQFVELQATAEKTAFDDTQLASLLALARARHRGSGRDSEAVRNIVIVYCGTSNTGKLREFQLAAPDFEIRAISAPAARRKTARLRRNGAIDKALYYGARRRVTCSPTIRGWKWTRWAARPACIPRASRVPMRPTSE